MAYSRIAHGPTLLQDRVGGELRPLTPPPRSHSMSDPTCLFCKIVAGQIPAEVVHRTDDVLAFRDINPAAPTHILVIPIEHISSLAAAEDEHRELLGRIALAARDIAIEEGVSESGYRTVMNTGGDGGQSVHHLHLHLLGGRALSWPAG